MDWKICTPSSVFIILLICSQCSCNWNFMINKGKDKKGQISWEEHQEHHYKRQKREWVAPTVNIHEEQDNRKENPIAKVHSDMGEKKGALRYKVSGHGVDQPPFGIFIIDPITGYLNVTAAIVDREEIPMFFLTCQAYSLSGYEVEKPLQLRVRVLDINDNPPIFTSGVFQGEVEENCKASTLVMQITATDADEEYTVNSMIAYKMISQHPNNPEAFMINRKTGQVFTIGNSLDREAVSGYSLAVGGTDLDGAAGGMSGNCGVNIAIKDVNDNFPTLEFDSYSVAIQENMVGFSDLRMKVFDLDEMYSDNWIANFEIVSGNEGGWFAIETDAQTNEGCLKIVKALDYEAMQAANLAILVKNRAAFHQSVMSQYKAKATSIAVQVQNVKEGYVFKPSNINVQIPAGLSAQELIQYVLTKVVAVDLDTGGPATNVVYHLDKESSKWFIIDSKTGEIRMTYELIQQTLNNNANNNGGGGGPNNNNGPTNYTGTVFATDENDPDLLSSGTFTITNPNTNQACPVITPQSHVLCIGQTDVILRATQNPMNPPLRMSLRDNPDWTITTINDTAARLTLVRSLGVGNYSVPVYVTDRNNTSCPNPNNVIIQRCECIAPGSCDASKLTGRNVSLGPAAIGLMVLGFLALLLALLLLPLCVCGSGAGAGGFVPVAEAYDGAYHAWGTEGAQPEDVNVGRSLISAGGNDGFDLNANNFGAGVGAGTRSISETAKKSGLTGDSATRMETATALGDGFDGAGFIDYSGESNRANSYMGTMPPPYEKSGPLNMAYVENYFAEKAELYANEDESRPANDCLLIYDNEGVGSPVGSVGCCSFIADDLDDTFLDTLGPKFKTLAEICIGSEIEPLSSAEEPRLFPIIDTEASVIVNDSTVNLAANRSMPVSSTTYVTESSMSSANLQQVRPMPETVLVTETYTTSGGTLRPVVRNVDPGLATNILVTERVVGSSAAGGMAAGHGVFPDLHNGSNVIVTERVVRPVSGAHEFIELPNLSETSNVVLRERVVGPSSSMMSNAFNISDLGDAQNVVLTERVVGPSGSRMSNAFNISDLGDAQNVVLTERVVGPSSSRMSNAFNISDLGDAQNVVVTERLIQPISNGQGTLSIRQEMGSSQNIYVTEKTVRSGPAIKTQMLSAEPLLTQTMGSTSPSLTRSKVTKYSTVQYTKQ